jgi:hypothetical protein
MSYRFRLANPIPVRDARRGAVTVTADTAGRR